jgi:hypothetical protein
MEKRGTTRRFLARSFYLFISSICQCLFDILFPLVSTEELRVRGSEVSVLYIRGVDHLGEKNKHKHFYLSTRVPHHYANITFY